MKKNTIFVTISMIFLIVVLLCVWIGGTIMSKSGSDSAAVGAPVDYVIILGCQINGEEPSDCLTERIDTAMAFLKEHPTAIAVCSGGQGSDEIITEAEAISLALQKKGLSKKRILLEDQSHSTYENLFNTKEILDKKESDKAYRVAIATNDFHIYRTRRLANHLGYQDPVALSAKTPTTIFYPNLLREIGAVIVTYFEHFR